MAAVWTFKEARPGDRARESQVEKFFNSDDVANRANAIVREGIQNSLDAAPDSVTVRIRISVRSWSDTEKAHRLPKYTAGFDEHFQVESVQKKLADPPKPADEFRYLVFEDFGTSGLKGEPQQWWPDEHGVPNPFFNYFRAEGISDKTDGARGRHGVGRLVFMFASRIRSMFGLTQREDGEQLLMGTSVLRNHWLHQKPYLPDGWFGVLDPSDAGLTLPVRNDTDTLAQFKSDFSVTRSDENGLSVIVPWLTADVTVPEIIKSVLIGYFYPIFRDKLVVEVLDDKGDRLKIAADTIDAVLATQPVELQESLKPILSLAKASLSCATPIELPKPVGNPKWSELILDDAMKGEVHSLLESGQPLALRVPMQVRPKVGPSSACHFSIFLQRDASAADGQIIFIREGIIISDARHTDNRQVRCPGVRAIVVIDEGPLASFLGDSENPSHTQWQHAYIQDKYTFSKMHVEYVVGSVPGILKLISDALKKPDTSLLLDLFSLSSDEPVHPPAKRKQPKSKEGVDPDVPPIDIPPTSKPFLVSKHADGFVIRPGGERSTRPAAIAVKVAYGVRRGSPFTKYNVADFRIGLGGVEANVKGGEIVDFDDNWMLVHIDEDDFEISVLGFDINRDIHVDARVKEREIADAAKA